jgi:hypothetical protein
MFENRVQRRIFGPKMDEIIIVSSSILFTLRQM